MPRLARSAALLLIVSARLAFSQPGAIPEPQWRAMVGDDPRWSDPYFDDSAWPKSPGPQSFRQTDDPFSGIRWYRASFPATPDTPMALGTGPIDDAFQIFVEGTEIGHFGVWEPRPLYYVARHLSFAVPAGLIRRGTALVAIRRWTLGPRGTFSAFNGAGATIRRHDPEFGEARTIAQTERLHTLETLEAFFTSAFSHSVLLVCGLVCLALFAAQRNHREYLWLGISFCLTGGGRVLGMVSGRTELIPQSSAFALIVTAVVYVGSNLSDYFFLAELAPRLRRVLRTWGFLVTIQSILLVVAFASGNGPGEHNLLAVARWRPLVALPPTLAVVWACGRRRQFDSVILALGFFASVAVSLWRPQLVSWMGGTATRFPLGPLQIDPYDISSMLSALVMLTVLGLRYRREQFRQTVIETELAAAQGVQEMLLGRNATPAPGFTVDAVYRPAQEVGGDFYQVLPGEDGSLLVVVGDVSGKGLRAAMVVSSVIGSLRTQVSRCPADVLSLLNRSLTGHCGLGFVTCCCALFHADGRLEIASAGHPAPYLNGEELEIEPGLPLGLSGDFVWAQTCLRIGDGMVTMLSDGVPEARNVRGELLGFDRTAALIRKSACEVADAAQAFGQDDDITVVTVQRNKP